MSKDEGESRVGRQPSPLMLSTNGLSGKQDFRLAVPVYFLPINSKMIKAEH
jgi:hypothetical protein